MIINIIEGNSRLVSSYLLSIDQTLREDIMKNRMEESLELFEDVANVQWFNSANIILFLNKRDLLQEKISTSSLKKYFSDYKGGDSYTEAMQFISAMFQERYHNTRKTLYVHYTTATDTNNIQRVFSAVRGSNVNI